MTISTTANRQDYTGDNCTKVFQFTYKILATTDLDVYVDNCLKTITTDYTVSGVGAPTGGNVTFVTAPGCTLAVALVRDVPYTQATAYPENNPFPAASHEDALDKLTMLVQQVRELTIRTWRFAAGSARAAGGYVVDEPKASTYPRVKADCAGIEFVTLTACGTYADPVTTKGDLIVGSSAGSQERLGITSGYTLVGDSATGTGKPRWMPGLSVELTNKADAALVAGDVVGVDTDCDRAVVARNVQNCLGIFVVAPAAIGDDCLALFHYQGLIRNVKAQGAIPRGNYVRKSSTAQAVEDTGAAMGLQRPPSGTLGVALTAAAASLVDVLFGGTPLIGTEIAPLELSPCDATVSVGAAAPASVRNVGVHGTDWTWDFSNTVEQCLMWEKVLADCLLFAGAFFHVQSRQAAATSGTLGWVVETRAVGDGDTWDAAYTNSDTVVATNVKAVAGAVLYQCIQLTTTGWTCNRLLRVKLKRDINNDNVAENAKFMKGYIRFL